MTTQPNTKVATISLCFLAAIGGILEIWAFVPLITGLASVNWQVPEMARQFMVATGNILEYETLVDYYSHIKGMEYLIAVALFVAFPIFHKHLNPQVKEARTSRK